MCPSENETETVPSEQNSLEAPANRGAFAEAYCESLALIFDPKPEEFRITDFLNEVGPGAANDPAGAFTCNPSDPASGYHLHVSWRKRKEFSLRIVFVGKSKPKDAGEREPFAETFMQWVGQFFVADGPKKVHTHADFEYPSAVRTVGFFPLPMTATVASRDVEIDGISFKVDQPINGVEKFWLTQLEDRLVVHLTAEREIDFRSFVAAEELAILSDSIDKVLGREKQ